MFAQQVFIWPRRAIAIGLLLTLGVTHAFAQTRARAGEVSAPAPKTSSSYIPRSSQPAPADDIFNQSTRDRSIPPSVSQGPFSGAFRFRTAEELRTQGTSRGFWRARLGGTAARENLDQEYMGRARVLGLAEHQFNETLMLRGEARVQFDSGYSQTVYNQQNRQAVIRLNEAKVHWRPAIFSVEAGILNQDFFNSPFLFDEQSFPAAREGIMWEQPSYGGGFFLQQAVPTSGSLSNPAAEREAMPRLATESAIAFVRPVPEWFVEASVHRFTFLDLPAAVAGESSRGGNTVQGVANNAKFAYGYQGFVYSIRTFGAVGSRLQPGGRVQLIQNTLADAGRDLGMYARGELGIRVSGTNWLIPRYEVFRVASDTSPASYNSWQMRNNNRIGWAAGLTYRSLDWNFRVTGRYQEADVIQPVAAQGPARSALLVLETDYASF